MSYNKQKYLLQCIFSKIERDQSFLLATVTPLFLRGKIWKLLNDTGSVPHKEK